MRSTIRGRWIVRWHYAGVAYRREVHSYERALRVAEQVAATGCPVVLRVS